MTATRREAIGLAGGVLVAGLAAGTRNALAEKALPKWSPFVTHYDSIGQAPSMVVSFDPANTIASLVFDKMEISLQGNDQNKLSGSIGLAGHFALTLPDEIPLRGFVLIARGIVAKSFDSDALLSLTIGDGARVLDWPRTSKVASNGKPENGTKEFEFDADCFSGDQHLAMGDPPKFPPTAPLTLSVGMHARRRTTEDSLLFQLNSIEIGMLSFSA